MEQSWQTYKTLGEQATAAQDFERAEAAWAMAILVAEEFGEKNPRLVNALDCLSHVLLRRQKYELAERFLVRSWRIKTKVLGAGQLELARTLNIIAEVYYCQGKWLESQQMCQRVYDVYVQEYGREHPTTVTAQSNLALLVEANRQAGIGQPAPPPAPATAPQHHQAVMQSPPQQQHSQAQIPHQSQQAQSVSQQMVHQQRSQSQYPQHPGAVNTAPTAPTTAPRPRQAAMTCEVCGASLEGIEECLRCTSTTIRTLRMDERLT